MKRFVLQADVSSISTFFGVDDINEHDLSLSYNHAEGNRINVIHLQDDRPVMQLRPWIRPFQHKTLPYLHTEELNGMVSGVRTAVIPVSGFYVWKEKLDDPLPFYIRRHDHPLLAVAGFLMSGDDGTDGIVPLTTGANALIRPIRSNMPVIISEGLVRRWLDGDVKDVLQEISTDLSMLTDMTVFRVSEAVNDVKAEGSELIQPIPKRDDED